MEQVFRKSGIQQALQFLVHFRKQPSPYPKKTYALICLGLMMWLNCHSRVFLIPKWASRQVYVSTKRFFVDAIFLAMSIVLSCASCVRTRVRCDLKQNRWRKDKATKHAKIVNKIYLRNANKMTCAKIVTGHCGKATLTTFPKIVTTHGWSAT